VTLSKIHKKGKGGSGKSAGKGEGSKDCKRKTTGELSTAVAAPEEITWVKGRKRISITHQSGMLRRSGARTVAEGERVKGKSPAKGSGPGWCLGNPGKGAEGENLKEIRK